MPAVKAVPFFRNVEDGYTCVRTCANDDATCRTNVTKELLYQFRALPSIAAPLTKPREVSRIRALLGTPYIVEYRLDARNEGVFGVRQIGNIGVVEVRRPVRGPATHLIRLHILTRTLHGALMAHNYAHIEVHVSANYF